MTLEEIENNLIALAGQILHNRQREMAWIETAFQNVHYTDPEITAEIRENTRHFSAAVNLAFLVVSIEDYLPKPVWRDDLHAHGYMSDDDYELLLALRHIRNTFGHSYNGERARQNVDEVAAFDNVMNTRKVEILPHVEFDVASDRIIVDTGASQHISNLLITRIQYLTATVHTARTP